MKLLIEGKAKKVFITEKKNVLLQYFKDDATAFNNKKRRVYENKGILNNKISTLIFKFLNNNNINTHFIKQVDERSQLIKKVKIVPLEVVIRNYSAGSISKKFNISKGTKFKTPIIEYYFKSDELDDPFMNTDHILYLNLATQQEIKKINKVSLKINTLLTKLFSEIDILLVDFKIEYGRYNKNIILADEISPDSCRLWDKNSKESFDKDLFRQDKTGLIEAYENIYIKLKNLNRGNYV